MRTNILTLALFAGSALAGFENMDIGGMGGMAIERDLAGRLMPDSNNDLQLDGSGVVVRATGVNLQTFTGALQSIPAPPILSSGDPKRPFQVGDSTFTDFKGAFTRSCNDQHNACAEAANAKPPTGLTVPQCDDQQNSCTAAFASATQTSFPTLFSSDAQFDYFCDP